MKNKIENRLVWVNVTRDNHSLLAIADQQVCEDCDEYRWQVYMTLDQNHKLTKTHCCLTTRVPKQKCPLCNPSRALDVNWLCQGCYDALIHHTKTLYDICRCTSKKCVCKYCRALGRV